MFQQLTQTARQANKTLAQLGVTAVSMFEALQRQREPKLPEPSIERALHASLRIHGAPLTAVDALWIVGLVPNLLGAPHAARYSFVGFLIVGIIALFKRGRLLINDYKNQKLTYFAGRPPEEPLSPEDDETAAMHALQQVAQAVSLILAMLKV